jgi:hypothetical protein
MLFVTIEGQGLSWSYGSWIYNYLCNQCHSPLMLRVWISIRARCTTLCDKSCQWLAAGRWFSSGTLISSTNKTHRHDITALLLKITLNTINLNRMFYISLFVLLYFLFWPLCCLFFFDLRILITPWYLQTWKPSKW